MHQKHHITKVEFSRFKAFRSFRLDLRHFNILVGPNNAGKSTILAAFRILAAAMRKAGARAAVPVHGPHGMVQGHSVDLSAISVAEENIFFDYDESEGAHVKFKLSNGNELTLYFPESGVCYLLADAKGRYSGTPAVFRSQFNCQIGFVPILGPVEHHEPLYEKEAARLALFNYRAARNFRNIWYHYPEKFPEFRALLQQTWPGMDIEQPEIDRTHGKPRLHMYCPEKRKPRELFWSGFGFQVWCQMLTHIIQSSDVSIFLIDEPDIYLHSELQRQLLQILRDLGPDVLIATHSTELIIEAEVDDIVLIGKDRGIGRRIKDPNQLEEVFSILGSNMNPILTQLAKTRRALFVEGKDFGILGKFARKIGASGVGSRRDFAVVPVEGFNPERIRSLKRGMETTLGGSIVAAALFDRDFRCPEECAYIENNCKEFCDYVVIHGCKEVENFLLVPEAIDRALARRLDDSVRRSGIKKIFQPIADKALADYSVQQRNYILSQLLSERRKFGRQTGEKLHETEMNEEVIKQFESVWNDARGMTALLPGKDAFGAINGAAQVQLGVNVTATAVIEAMREAEIPEGVRSIVSMLAEFSAQTV